MAAIADGKDPPPVRMHDMAQELLLQFDELFGWVSAILPNHPIETLHKMDTASFLRLLEKAEAEQVRRMNSGR